MLDVENVDVMDHKLEDRRSRVLFKDSLSGDNHQQSLSKKPCEGKVLQLKDSWPAEDLVIRMNS